MGTKPSAVSRAAVWLAPGSGLVIKTRFKGPLLSKRLRSMMCGRAEARRYPTFRRIATETETGCRVPGPGHRLERCDETGSGDRDVLR